MLGKLLLVNMGELELETSNMMTTRLEINESQWQSHVYVLDTPMRSSTICSKRQHQSLILNISNEELRREDWNVPTKYLPL